MADHPDNAHLPVVNRPETIIAVVVSFIAIAVLAVSLRLWIRLKARICGWDDFFIFLAAISTTAGSVMTCLMPAYGLGLHFNTLSGYQVVNYYKYVWSCNLVYCASTTFIKLAILIQYLRLFDMQSRPARLATWSIIIFTALWGTTFFLLALFACRPIAKNWNFLLPGTCVAWGSKNADTFFATWAAHAATNMFFDILVFVLPIPFLKGLRMQSKTRLGLFGLFTMGAVVVSLSVARMVSISIKRAGTVPVFDPSFATPLIFISSALEVNMAILCASIPIFWPLVASFAAGKILVVQEIEVRTDWRGTGQSLGLAEQGASVGTGTFGVPGLEMVSRMSVTAYGKETKRNGSIATNGSKLVRSASRQHRSKPSTSSSGGSVAIELGSRVSHESQRRLNLLHQPSDGALSLSLSASSSLSQPSSMERSPSRYQQDRYMLIPPDRARKTET